MQQLAIDFTTQSPINVERLKKQNRRLLDFLLTGQKIHCFSEAKQKLHIGYLNSRCSDLINKNKIPIEKKRIKVEDIDGELTDVVEYWLSPETIIQLKNILTAA